MIGELRTHIDVKLVAAEFLVVFADVNQFELQLYIAGKQHERCLSIAKMRSRDLLIARNEVFAPEMVCVPICDSGLRLFLADTECLQFLLDIFNNFEHHRVVLAFLFCSLACDHFATFFPNIISRRVGQPLDVVDHFLCQSVQLVLVGLHP